MYRRISLATLLIAGLSVPALAQSEAVEGAAAEAQSAAESAEAAVAGATGMEEGPRGTLVFEVDGEVHEYEVGDFNLSLTRGMSYDGSESRGEASVFLTGISPVDGPLLEWARQGPSAGNGARDVTLRTNRDEGPGEFELEAARVTSISLTTGSTSLVSLQLGLRLLRIDGMAMN